MGAGQGKDVRSLREGGSELRESERSGVRMEEGLGVKIDVKMKKRLILGKRLASGDVNPKT